MRPREDYLNFNGAFLATNTSLVSRGAPGKGETLLTRASTTRGNLAFSSEDHRDVRLHYDSRIIPRLSYGETYSLAGCVLGGRKYEMPFLDCERHLSDPSRNVVGEGVPPNITGVGSIVGVFKLNDNVNDGDNVEVFVVHKVDEYTVSKCPSNPLNSRIQLTPCP
ncbi:hypothetical protein MJO28_008807 [Puccinia striiformis f. sp. tritici]|uniref:Uncharacterized protein n=1 Tax=Puccinia striiformis f. sp. tritici TaxID=168172 RepID=A0ACC0EDQ6_9BASI|nr:hypothetical protein MJO28_008807 [Puccinia striiformis f. sp. tritici]